MNMINNAFSTLAKFIILQLDQWITKVIMIMRTTTTIATTSTTTPTKTRTM